MIEGKKVIAFTPCGRRRYMNLLAAHLKREHDRGHIDKWVVFQNAFTWEDVAFAEQLAAHFPWVEAVQPQDGRKGLATPFTAHLSDFYKWMPRENDAIYVRFDDDIVYVNEECIPRLVKYRLALPEPFLMFPVIINNVRTSYQMQQCGIVPKEWGEIKNEMCNVRAWKDPTYVQRLHRKALDAINGGPDRLAQEFSMPTGSFAEIPFGNDDDHKSEPIWAAGNISINCFAIAGADLFGFDIPWNEEGALSLFRPKEVNRPNARCGNAFVSHFAYHTQTDAMDKSGMLAEYAKLAPPNDFVYAAPAPQPESRAAVAQRKIFNRQRRHGNARA